jgi:hypothetical protein
METKSDLQTKLNDLLSLHSEKVSFYISRQQSADQVLMLLMQEIASNKDTPPEILELAKAFELKRQEQLSAGSDVYRISQEMNSVREVLFKL